jgi:hypothetical protein
MTCESLITALPMKLSVFCICSALQKNKKE